MKGMRLPDLILTAVLLCAVGVARGDTGDPSGQPRAQANFDAQGSPMQIRMDIEGTIITAALVDNATARDFASLLSLTLTLEDYAATEKVSYLPRRLSTEGAPRGIDPSVGDIAYYAPWGNLALYYRDFGYSTGLVKLGTIVSGIEALSRPGPLRVTIDVVKEQ